MLDRRDALVQESCPLLPVPRYGELEPMAEPGQRILMAGNGVFVQVKLHWMDAVQRIGDIAPGFPVPYGDMEESLTLACGVLPADLLAQFEAMARTAYPNETAAAIVWSRTLRTLRLVHLHTFAATPVHVSYARLRLADNTLAADEDVVLDLHSHATLPAFFSHTDDRDDRGFKLCGVLGELHAEVPSAVFRLCINGHYSTPRFPWDCGSLPYRRGRSTC